MESNHDLQLFVLLATVCDSVHTVIKLVVVKVQILFGSCLDNFDRVIPGWTTELIMRAKFVIFVWFQETKIPSDH